MRQLADPLPRLQQRTHTAAGYYNHSPSREVQIALTTTFSKGIINLKKNDTQKQYLMNILNTASAMINTS